MKTALVVGVGAARGLGVALCRRFAVEGYNVVVSGRTVARGAARAVPVEPPDCGSMTKPPPEIVRSGRKGKVTA